MVKLHSRVGLTSAFLCTVCLAPVFAQDAPDDPLGYWINRAGWVIEAASCDGGLCGTIVGMGGLTDDSQRTDVHNPDPDLRQRTLCGADIFGAFEPNGSPDEWEGGWIYNPQDGKTYSSNMKLGDEDTLELRGYVLSPIFGRTIVLVRGEEPVEPCDAGEALEEQEADAE